MAFHLDSEKIQRPPPGSFEANILRTIEVPYQRIDVSGDQYPLSRPLEAATVPVFVFDWEKMGAISLPATVEAAGSGEPKKK